MDTRSPVENETQVALEVLVYIIFAEKIEVVMESNKSIVSALDM